MDTGFVLTQIFAIIAFVFLFFQLYSTYYLLSSQSYSNRKKFQYMLLIWCLPLVGGLLVLNWMLPEEIEIPNLYQKQSSMVNPSVSTNVEKNPPRDHESVL